MVPHQPEVKGGPRFSPDARLVLTRPAPARAVGGGERCADPAKEGPRLVGDSQGPLGQGGTGLPDRTAWTF
jgi:hypothetical protein